jgi:hypothetical protein
VATLIEKAMWPGSLPLRGTDCSSRADGKYRISLESWASERNVHVPARQWLWPQFFDLRAPRKNVTLKLPDSDFLLWAKKWMLLQTRNCDVLDGHVIVGSMAE